MNVQPLFDENKNKWTWHLDATTEEMLTIYFALRSARDSYDDSLTKDTQNTIEREDIEDGVPFDVAQHANIHYEDLAFLHYELYKVNNMLFDIILNHDPQTRTIVESVLSVD